MSSWFGRWFAYGLGRAAGKAVFDEEEDDRAPRGDVDPPIRPQTEAEILEDERRYDEEAKQYAAEDAARRAAKKHR